MTRECDIIICGHGSGNPSLKRLDKYAESRYKKIAENGVRKGIVCVRRLKSVNSLDRQRRFNAIYGQILGRNIYSQKLREYVFVKYRDGKFYSDCSSSGMKSFEKAGLYAGATLNTAGIYKSSLFIDVPVLIEDGHIMNPEVLQIGDAILFAGNDPERPRQIGHVEYVYTVCGKPAIKPVKMTIAQKVIKRGDKGVNVKYLQMNLNEAINAGLEVDGSAGSKTIEALKKWQQFAGLVPDGSYGAKSEAAMKEMLG